MMGNALSSSAPKCCPEPRNFSEAVNKYRTEKNITCSELANRSCVSKTTVSRILRNENDKGTTYRPDINIVFLISIGLGLSPQQFEMLLLLAYPELTIWREALEQHRNVDDVLIDLYENGLPLPTRWNDD